MKRFLVLTMLLMLAIPSSGSAALYSRAWSNDTTFTAAATVNTITFTPHDIYGNFTADAWAVKLLAADDTSTVRVGYFFTGNDTVGGSHYSQFTLSAGQARGIPARADYIRVFLPANHATTQFEIVAIAGSAFPPFLGHERMDITGLNEALVDSAMAAINEAFMGVHNAVRVHTDGDTATVSAPLPIGNTYGHVVTLTAGAPTWTDSIAGASAKKHIGIRKAIITSDAHVHLTWYNAAGTDLAAGWYINADEALVLDPVDLWKIAFTRAVADANIRTTLEAIGAERSGP